MSAKILDGKKLASEIKEELKKEVLGLKDEGIIPGLAVISAGYDPASEIYVNAKIKVSEDLGINSVVYKLEENVTQEELGELVGKLNKDPNIHGILVQLPLPKHLDEKKITRNVSVQKDVDCFHPENVGNVLLGDEGFLPCTPAGIIEIIKRSDIAISGAHCVVVGRSNIVGKPLALMLLNFGGTITVCHSKTKDLARCCREADILVSAVGRAGLITQDMVKKGAVVIDVGINRLDNGKVAGDVDFDKVSQIASFITPVPGGVGPMTIVSLMKNTIKAAKNFNKI